MMLQIRQSAAGRDPVLGRGRRARRVVPAAAALLALAAAGCHRGAAPDAYGNFEATEVVVSAQTPGQLLWFSPNEGDRIPAGALVGVVDTTQLSLERAQIVEQRASTSDRAAQANEQADALEVQRGVARRAYERAKRLYDEHAGTAQQLDQAERDYRSLVQQIDALRAQARSVTRDVAASEARVAATRDRLAKSRITSPIGGTVLATYTRAGEFVQPGQPLYKIAALDTLELRAYVTEPQLAAVRLDAPAQVTVDRGGGSRAVLPGRVSWVSSRAEFTPTPVQTRDERADLVYAVKVRVANPDGMLKIGMPADVRFGVPAAGTEPPPARAMRP